MERIKQTTALPIPARERIVRKVHAAASPSASRTRVIPKWPAAGLDLGVPASARSACNSVARHRVGQPRPHVDLVLQVHRAGDDVADGRRVGVLRFRPDQRRVRGVERRRQRHGRADRARGAVLGVAPGDLGDALASIFTLDTVIFSLVSSNRARRSRRRGVEDIGHVGIGDIRRLRDEVAERARDQRDLAVDRDRLRHFDAAEIERDHQRQQHRELDRRDAALVAQRSGAIGRRARAARRAKASWRASH